MEQRCGCGNVFTPAVGEPVCIACRWRAAGYDVSHDFNVCDVANDGKWEFWSDSAVEALASLETARETRPLEPMHVVAYPEYVTDEGKLISNYQTFHYVDDDALRALAARETT